MYQEVLLPTDGADGIRAVYDHAAALARDGATVHVLYVVDDRAYLTLAEGLRDDVTAELEAEGEAATVDARVALEERGCDVRTAVRRGDPAAEILAYVAEAGIDVVAMGTRGADFERNMVGSVSARVVGESPVPVMTVRLSGDGDGDGERRSHRGQRRKSPGS
jgi:nucleotide-binding universal stress UspA family protein